MARQHPDCALSFADETGRSRFARSHLYTWADSTAGPLRLIEQEAPKADPDPKALARYGIRLQQAGQDKRVWLRFIDGQPVSAIVEQFLEWCCHNL